jgi:hypothetical protein
MRPVEPLETRTAGLSFSAFAKYIVHEVERALHKAVHWGLAIANNCDIVQPNPTCGKPEESAAYCGSCVIQQKGICGHPVRTGHEFARQQLRPDD